MNKETFFCCICGTRINGIGNNPAPVAMGGRCCDRCNETVVIPERLKATKAQKTAEAPARRTTR